MKVHLTTTDSLLETYILKEYPGKITQKQYMKLEYENINFYTFIQLEKDQLEELLKPLKDQYKYIIYTNEKILYQNGNIHDLRYRLN